MAYNITLTDGSIYTVIPDGSINDQSSMTLIGQNYVGGYGLFQNDNFIRLLENGSNSTPPGAPLTGQLWFNTVKKTLEVYNGSVFKAVGTANASATAPTSNNAVGDLWYNTSQQQVYVWSGTGWVLVGPEGIPGTAAIGLTLYDSGSTGHDVLSFQVDGNIVALVSDSVSFTPVPALPGFSTVSPGITLSTSVNSQTPLLVGTATNAQALNGLPSSSFMSTVSNSWTTGTVNILNNNGLTIGNNSQITANLVGNTAFVTNNTLAGNIAFTVNNSGVLTTVLTVDGIVPQIAVAGNAIATGFISATSFIGDGGQLANIDGGNVTGNVSSAISLHTGNFIISEKGNPPALYFQTISGNYVAKLQENGNLLVSGNVIPNSTITYP